MEPSLEISSVDLSELLAGPLTTNQTWTDLIDAFRQLIQSNVEAPIQQLERIRFMDSSDETLLGYTCRLLGFDLTQDVLNLNTGNLLKVATQLSMYPDQNGTILFANFLNLILNAVTNVQYLYTKNYVQFFAAPGGDLIIDGGEWFKSTHVNLTIDLLSLNTLTMAPGVTLYDKVIEIFYAFAPAALVVKSTTINVDSDPISFGFAAAEIPLTVSYVTI